MTNAHVVAGADTVRVGQGGELYDAAPVHFDPDLDIALLYAPGLPAPPLPLALIDPARGVTGATFGFPGGRALMARPAAVTHAYAAQGRDIYGERRIFAFRKGSACLLEFAGEVGAGAATLLWAMTPAQLRALAD